MNLNDYDLIWKDIYKKIEQTIGFNSYSILFKNFNIINIYNNEITIFTNLINIHSLIDNKIIAQINNIITNHMQIKKLIITYQANYISYPIIDKNKTLRNFIVNSENRLAMAVAKEICSNKSQSKYSPFFIYAQAGLGKSHLLNGIALEYTQKHPKQNIIWYNGTTFIDCIEQANNNHSLTIWKKYHTSCSLFIFDDIQLLENNLHAINIFNSIFDIMYNCKQNPQIILTSNILINDLVKFPESLKSRLQWGVKIIVHKPDNITKEGIIENHCIKNKISLNLEVIKYISKNYTNSIRELEGLINTAYTYSILLNKTIDIDMIKDIINDKDNNNIKYSQTVTGEDIIFNVCQYFNINQNEIKSNNRQRRIAFPRQVGMYITKKLTNMSLQEIGQIYGNRDHSTVKHSNDKIQFLFNNDLKTKQIINTIIDTLNNKIIQNNT